MVYYYRYYGNPHGLLFLDSWATFFDLLVCLALSFRGMLCILHWSLCVYKEFRSIWLALEAVVVIPKSSHTSMDDSIQSLSMLRCFFIFLTFLLRLVIASMLLVAGISWLARTTSITEPWVVKLELRGSKMAQCPMEKAETKRSPRGYECDMIYIYMMLSKLGCSW